MDNSSGLTYVITRLIVLTNVLILCMLINSKLLIYIIILILTYQFGLPQLNNKAILPLFTTLACIFKLSMRELMIGFSNISKMLCAGNVVLYQIKPKYCQNTKHIESQSNPDELKYFWILCSF